MRALQVGVRTIDSKRVLFRLLRGVLCFVLGGGVAGISFILHLNLSTAGSLELLLILLIALRWGFGAATVASLSAVAGLNYLFTPPLFEFTVADPENWISLATFEGTALLVSGLSAKVRLHAEQVELQRARAEKLYALSRAVLLIDSRKPIGEQLVSLIRELIGAKAVELWIADDTPSLPWDAEAGSARATFESGLDDDEETVSRRVLRLGMTPVGAMVLREWEMDASLADAVASLAAVALERARALRKENRAEAERNTEQLRTGVLDGLAHGFKTPLTAIQTASSGLLAIGGLNETQTELVSIVDEEATKLARMTTRLLQTASLDAREVRLTRSSVMIADLVMDVIGQLDEAAQRRVAVSIDPGVSPMQVDSQMIGLAILQLVDNAAKYGEVGSRITIGILQSDSEIKVEVTNLGTPIRREERERIFERFYRGVDAVHGPTGTGIGLSVVKKAVEAHGGSVGVECEGGATKFVLTLPRHVGRG
ncbi:sensor histidine kinase [Granulicella sibirica]|uniref:histidine kinase n=1 Tax=Granulicella sibirica TaxID=2479048 RepID=A0A4V1L564_9BACT|nr:DUF4118 domain-containing protein [Granulicella sibirica]RXH54674.1 Osmosensitive K+ channel histidine kinase KdpD [Granulicella sibirica]